MRNTLIEARGKKTQAAISAEIGITQKYLSKLELGQRNPSLKIAVKIASYLWKKPPICSNKNIIEWGGAEINGNKPYESR